MQTLPAEDGQLEEAKPEEASPHHGSTKRQEYQTTRCLSITRQEETSLLFGGIPIVPAGKTVLLVPRTPDCRLKPDLAG
jgi:hypothetical protein